MCDHYNKQRCCTRNTVRYYEKEKKTTTTITTPLQIHTQNPSPASGNGGWLEQGVEART